MTTVFDVPADALLTEATRLLKGEKTIAPPEWAAFARTGVHTESPPVQPDWWHTRVAAVLRKVYTDGPIGTETLRGHFGGFRDRGSKPNKAVKGSGSVARHALQQLEAAELITSIQGQGRVVTAKGRSMMDNAAHKVRASVQKKIPALAKY